MKSALLFSFLFCSLSWAQKPAPLFNVRSHHAFELSGKFVQDKTLRDGELISCRKLNVKLKARGNSSTRPGEATFPKLSVEFDARENLGGTVFEGTKKFRINTHVNTFPKSKYTEMGRLNGDLSTWREVLAYEISEEIGLPTIGRRRALVKYNELGNESFVRKALLLETDESFADRLKMRLISIPEFALAKETRISKNESALLHVFMAFIGNEDFVLRNSDESPSAKGPEWDLGNVIVLERKDGTRIVGPYDFDRSTFAAGYGFLEYSMYEPENADAYLKMRIESVYQRHPKEAVDLAVQKIIERSDSIRRLIETAEIDDDGRTIAHQHLTRFMKYFSGR